MASRSVLQGFPVMRLLAHVRQSVSVRQRERRMHVVEHLSLGGKKSVAIVSVDGREYLIGSGSDVVSTIVPLTHHEGGDL